MTTWPPIPLTTTFTPPSNCLGQYELGLYYSLESLITESYINVPFPVYTKSCFPSSYVELMWAGSAYFYSPGVCPSGYTSACTPYIRGILPTIDSGETAIQCCPSGFACESYSYCTSSLGETIIVTPKYYGLTATATDTPITITNGEYSTYPTFSVAWAYPVQVRYRSPSATETSTPSLTTANPITTTTTTATTATAGPGSGLSKEAVIAISVAVPLVVLALLIGFFLGWRSRRGRLNDASQPYDPLANPQHPSIVYVQQPPHTTQNPLAYAPEYLSPLTTYGFPAPELDVRSSS